MSDNWVISDITGRKCKASETVYGEDIEEGLLMHISEKSEYNPQFKLKARREDRSVSKVRLEQPYNFVTTAITPEDL